MFVLYYLFQWLISEIEKEINFNVDFVLSHNDKHAGVTEIRMIQGNVNRHALLLGRILKPK